MMPPTVRPHELILTSTGGRFAVLLHHAAEGLSRTRGDHFDWLFESRSGLITFACALDDARRAGWMPGTRPLPTPSFGFGCQPLPPHRPIYLDYEGPLSGNRGRVQRVESGRYRCLGHDDAAIDLAIEFDGLNPGQAASQSVQRICRLRRCDGGSIAWRLDLLVGR